LDSPAPDATQADRFRIGPIEVDAAGRHLLVDGRRIEADAQQVGVIVTLIRAWPGIVTKDALIDSVWGGRYVTDAALQKAISTLRRTLREHGLPEDAIETRHRRGYQLTVAPIAPGTTTTVEAASPNSAEQAQPSRRWRLWPWLLLILSIGAGIAIWTGQREAPAPAALRIPAIASAEHSAQLARLSDPALIEAITGNLGSDAAFAALAIQELRARSDQLPERSALADKYDGILAYRAGRFDEAQALYERALSGFRTAGNDLETSNVLNNLAILFSESGRDPAQAEAWYRESLDLRTRLGDRKAVMASHRNLANLLLEQGPLDRAEVAVAAYAEAAGRIGETADQVDARILQGDVVRDHGGDARPHYREAVAQATAQGLPQQSASAWQRIGRESLRLDQPDEARAAFEQAIALYRQSDPGHQLPWLYYNLATALDAEGETEQALRTYADVLRLSQGLPTSSLSVDARLRSAQLLATLGRRDEADRVLADAWRDAQLLANTQVEMGVLLARADLALQAGQIVAARRDVEAARKRAPARAHWELIVGLATQSALVAIAEGAVERARTEIDTLERELRDRADAQSVQRVAQLRALLAVSDGRFHEGYATLWRPTATAAASAVPAAIDPPQPVAWLWLCAGVLVGGVGGFLLRRR